MTMTYANRHRLATEGQPVRFAAPGELVRLAPGAYLTNVGLGITEALRVAALAHGIGALDQTSYGEVMAAIHAEGDDDGDVALAIVAQLNNAADNTACWAFVDGDLYCQTPSWYWDVEDARADGRA